MDKTATQGVYLIGAYIFIGLLKDGFMAILTDEEKRDILSSLTLWDDRFFSSCFDGDIESASLASTAI